MLETIVEKLPGRSKPRRTFLILVVQTILMMRGKVNFTNLERYAGVSERTFRRHFRISHEFTSINREVIRAVGSGELVIAMDASFLHKSGKRTPGLGRFWHGTAGRVERGLEVFLVGVVDAKNGRAFALDAAQNIPADDRTSVQAGLAHLAETKPFWPATVEYGVFDGWYAKEEFVTGAVSLGLHMIGKLRCDANLQYLFIGPHYPNRRGRRRKFLGKADLKNPIGFTEFGTPEPGVEYLTAIVHHVALKRAIRVVLTVDRTNPEKIRRHLFFSTDFTLDPETLVAYYRARFHLEFVFRDAKQFAGLEDCQARTAEALDFHFNASFCAVNIAKADSVDAKVFSMASHKLRAFNRLCLDRIISTFDLDTDRLKNHPRYEEFCNWGVLAA